jgi:putative effector of murein hydrolase
MYKELIVFLAQTLFNIFKVLEIKYTYQNKIGSLLINSIWINLVALASTYYAIDDLLNGKFTIIIFYIVGSVLGKYIGMQFGNPRNKVWKKLFNK